MNPFMYIPVSYTMHSNVYDDDYGDVYDDDDDIIHVCIGMHLLAPTNNGQTTL